MDVGPMDCGMATGRPTGAVTDKVGVINLANEEVPHPAGTRPLDLGMAFEAEIGIPLDEHLGVDRTMGFMADDAALAQRLMFENKGTGLVAVTGGTGLI